VSSGNSNSSVDREAGLLVDFVNTWDQDEGIDAIADAAALESWIRGSDGEVGAAEIDEAGHHRVLALRGALRALMLANNGRPADDQAVAPLRAAAARARYRTVLGAEGELELAPEGEGAPAFEARLLLALERLQATGAWPRLKVCPDETCEWAFFDESRNRSRTWCSMEVCGNRAKTRRYRRRRATT
jgi:predicted RNA-binding Zn ribbon-like protein